MAMDTDHQSICHVKASELYPKKNLVKEDKHLQIPFKTVCGESVELLGRTSDGILALSNYRLYLQLKDTFYNIPLGLIEMVEVRDIFYLYIGCKDARSLRCTFATNEHSQEWLRRLLKAIGSPKQIEEVFAFAYHAWAMEDGNEDVLARLSSRDHEHYYFKNEVDRLRFDVNGAWRISNVNINYKLCSSYPKLLLVPACITDDTLEMVARFRSAGRVPAVVWRHTGNGAVIARCSQPEVGWLGWRSSDDEDLIRAIADACAFDRGRSSLEDEDSPVDREPALVQGKKVLIMDARSYTTAVANRARGGGCECPEYYPRCEIQFMNLANIHSIRKSFHAVRQLCSLPEAPNWLSMLENSRWLLHMSGLLRAAVTVAAAIEREARPVLVHCSDGWDRTPQIVALAQLLLDPYYRTIDGFQTLVEREWLDFGHKFGDRCGNTVNNDDMNERCPVFLQWLDCVHQLLIQFPCSFQYSQDYLVKLAQHTYSNLFGTFLTNCSQERITLRVAERTFSVWKFLRASNFRNHLYSSDVGQVLWPSCNVRDLQLWNEVYIGSVETCVTSLNDSQAVVGVGLVKTRSYDDLVSATVVSSGRRSSHPNIASDVIKFDALTSSSNQESSVYINGSSNHIQEDIYEAVKDLNKLPSCSNDDNNSDCEDTTWRSEDTVVRLVNGCHGEGETDAGEVKVRRKNRTISEELYDHFVNNTEDVSESVCDDLEKLNTTSTSDDDGDNVVNSASCDDVEDVDDVDNNTPPTAAVVVAAAAPVNNNVGSIVSSTDTLVNVDMVNGNSVNSKDCEHMHVHHVNGVCAGAGVVYTNGYDNNYLQSCGGDTCKICTTPALNKREYSNASNSTSGRNSRYSTPPLYSRTPSNGYPATPVDAPRLKHNNVLLDVDGLQLLQDDVQARLNQIIIEHKTKEQALERELHTTRLALIQQVCHHCAHAGNNEEIVSRPESICSEPNPGSLPSDLSWEAVEERDAQPTLWVPDHAVARCQGCDTEFWLGRRKHHCRNCGKIFCADCSDNTTALPGEQLYEPVRVCNTCHSLLAPIIAETCKKATGCAAGDKITSSKTAAT